MATPDYLSSAEAQESLKSVLNVYSDNNGAFDEDRLIADINASEAEVNAAARSRYDIPATTAGTVLFLKGLTLALLRNRAYSRLASVETPMVIMSEAKAARTQLRDISAGRLLLPDAPQDTADGINQYIDTTYNTPQMKRSKLAGF